MIAPYSFHPVAAVELNEAAAYYDSEHRGLGLRFIDGVDAAILQIREHPESCPVVHDRSRSKLVDGFPYSVIYSFSGRSCARAGYRPPSSPALLLERTSLTLVGRISASSRRAGVIG